MFNFRIKKKDQMTIKNVRIEKKMVTLYFSNWKWNGAHFKFYSKMIWILSLINDKISLTIHNS
jgi:hypothetical protein